MAEMELIHEELTESIIGCYYNVYNALHYGFLEKVYENALMMELINAGHKVEAQKRIAVYYQGKIVGDYFADMVVDDLVILELKACESVREEHIAQLINYLRATSIELGLLLNFGKEPKVLRRVFMNVNKKSNKSS
ncbi:MAG: GxxExxY protein [Candidatus Cloacimonadaceae bacterium]|jgi:GxxExxY protein